MATAITYSTIDLIWSSPTAVVPIRYDVDRRCRRLCDSSGSSIIDASVFSPHKVTGVSPYSQCTLNLIGIYGIEMANSATYVTMTKLTGTIKYKNMF